MNVDKGYVDAPIPEGLDLRQAILQLKREKGAVILAHYYQRPEVQDLADYIGDSLALAQKASTLQAPLVVLCGVHFMGETAALLNPGTKVVVPDTNAGCSLADSCPAEQFADFIARHPGHTVVSYVNTTAAVKALSDLCVTSGNARRIIDSLPREEKIIFGPDKNLGEYINALTGRSMVLWDGACHVHERFSVERTAELMQVYPEAEVLVHPECTEPMRMLATVTGSTAVLLAHVKQSKATQFIVATESGILHQMMAECPDKTFIPAPPNDSTCACNDCAFMKLNTLEKLYNSLKYELPVVTVPDDIAERARRPIERMLALS